MAKECKNNEFDKTAFTVFDFETTGLSPYSGDRICEIGAIRIEPGKENKKFHSMINPEREISKGAYFVNRISKQILKDAPVIKEILPDFMAFIKGSVLVAYNAGFDAGFLECALGEKKGILKKHRILDALSLARRLFPESPRYNLATIANYLGIKVRQEHRAIYDAELTLKVFKKEIDVLTKQGIYCVEDIAQHTPKRKKLNTFKDHKMGVIKEAIKKGDELTITYSSGWTKSITERIITPKKIDEGYDKCYIFAYCHMRQADRSFIMDSIMRVKRSKKKEKV